MNKFFKSFLNDNYINNNHASNDHISSDHVSSNYVNDKGSYRDSYENSNVSKNNNVRGVKDINNNVITNNVITNNNVEVRKVDNGKLIGAEGIISPRNINLVSGILVAGIGFGVVVPRAEAVVGHQCPSNADVCIMGMGNSGNSPGTGVVSLPEGLPPDLLALLNNNLELPGNGSTPGSGGQVGTPGSGGQKVSTPGSGGQKVSTRGSGNDPFKICSKEEINALMGADTDVAVSEECNASLINALQSDPGFLVKAMGIFRKEIKNDITSMYQKYREETSKTSFEPQKSSDNGLGSPDQIQKYITDGVTQGLQQGLGQAVQQALEPLQNALGTLTSGLGGTNPFTNPFGQGIQNPFGQNPYDQGMQYNNPYSMIPNSPTAQYMGNIKNRMANITSDIQEYLESNASKAAEKTKEVEGLVKKAQENIDKGLKGAEEAQSALDGLENAEANADSELKALKGILKSSIANGKLIQGYGDSLVGLVDGYGSGVLARLDNIVHLQIAHLEAIGAMSAQQAAANHANQAALTQATHALSGLSGKPRQTTKLTLTGDIPRR